MSIYDNIAYGPRLHGVYSKAEMSEIVETSLRGASLWDEVKDRLKKSALGLSGGQQQRLCIARALAVKPDVLLMDEPTSALDPASTIRIEELMADLKQHYTVVIVTHNMLLIWAFSDGTNTNRKNWSRSRLILIGIGFALSIIFLIILIAAFSAGYYPRGFYNYGRW